LDYYTTPSHLPNATTTISCPTTAMSSTPAARYRKPAPTTPSNPVGEQEKAELKAAVRKQAAATSSRLSVLDVLRILGGVLLLSSGLSYLSTSGESMTWGYNAWWTRAREWKAILVRRHLLPTLTSTILQHAHTNTFSSNAKSTSPTPNSPPTTAPTPRNQSTLPSMAPSTTSPSPLLPTARVAPTTSSRAATPRALS
jgi:hypothetical protein